jgi:DEAD/DEAH box helicase domain-containing protein
LLLAKGVPASNSWTAPGVVLLDEGQAEDEEDLHREWRRWLQLFNACQFLPGILLTTATGLDGHDYDVLGIGDPTMSVLGEPAVSGAWQDVMDQVQTPLRPGLAALANMGAAVPEVGAELADDRGRVVADAELAWSEKRVVLLRPDQSDLAEVWQVQIWVVCQLDDGLTLIEGHPWASVVATVLRLKNNEE